MKHLNTYITEYIVKKKLDKPIDSEDHYKYTPKTKEELIENIKELLDKGETNLNCIDTSAITDMSHLFDMSLKKIINYNLTNVYFDVSKWNVSNVKDMQFIFYDCIKFDCDLSKWNISNVENIAAMFYNCKNFDCDLSNWVVGKVKDMSSMFYNCTNFNCDLSNWDISNVKNMSFAFYNCKSLKNTPSWYKE